LVDLLLSLTLDDLLEKAPPSLPMLLPLEGSDCFLYNPPGDYGTPNPFLGFYSSFDNSFYFAASSFA